MCIALENDCLGLELELIKDKSVFQDGERKRENKRASDESRVTFQLFIFNSFCIHSKIPGDSREELMHTSKDERVLFP